MKKGIALGLASIMAIVSLTGCSTGSEYLLDIDYSKYVKLCEYKNVETTKVVYDVTDDEIQEEIEIAMYDYATYDPVTNRGIEVGDNAIVTYIATIDGAENEYYSGEEEEIIVGEGFLYPDLEDALIGMKTGESKTVDVELTEEYAEEDYIGKTASVDVTVNQITVENIPEYNLNFVKENTEYDTLEAYEESVKANLVETKEEEYKYVAVDTIMTYLIENSEFDGYPEELYAQCEEVFNSNNEFYASMYGMTVEEYLETFGYDEATKKAEIEASVNYELVIGAIAQKEKIDCTSKDIKAYAENNYEDFGYETADEFLDDYSEEEIGYQIIYETVMDFLYENATFSEVSEDEYLKEQESYYYEDTESEPGESDSDNVITIENIESDEELSEDTEESTGAEESTESESEEVSTEE